MWAEKAGKMGDQIGRLAGKVADEVIQKEAQFGKKLRQVAQMPTVDPNNEGGSSGLGILLCCAILGIAVHLVSKAFHGMHKGKKGA